MSGVPEIDMNRRRFLIAASAAVGGAGFVMTAYPFVMSMMPSQKALAEGGPIEANIRPIEPGMLVTFTWRKQPVWVLHRTQAMLERLGKPWSLVRTVPDRPGHDRRYSRTVPTRCSSSTASRARRSRRSPGYCAGS